MNQKEFKNREPWLAVNLSLFFSGLGQIYSRRFLRGYLFIFGVILSLIIGVWLIWTPKGNLFLAVSFLLLATGIYIWSLFDAYRCVKRQNTMEFEYVRKGSKDPWLSVFLSRILPGVGHIYLRKRLWGIGFIICFIAFQIIFDRPLSIVLVALLSAFACYHAYISSPTQREGSLKIILLLSIAIFIFGLVDISTRRDVMITKIRLYYSPRNAMAPTIQAGDKFIVKRPSGYFPKRGDIITFKFPEDRAVIFLKRVIAFGGESVEIKEGSVYIDGNKLELPSIKNIHYLSMGSFGLTGNPYIVPDQSIFVLGDNSKNSRDSRFWGVFPEEDVIGKAYKIYWPLNRMGPI
jgi:signal peptidase I